MFDKKYSMATGYKPSFYENYEAKIINLKSFRLENQKIKIKNNNI